MLKTSMNQGLAYTYGINILSWAKVREMTAYLDYFSNIFQACYMLILYALKISKSEPVYEKSVMLMKKKTCNALSNWIAINSLLLLRNILNMHDWRHHVEFSWLDDNVREVWSLS